MDLTFFAAAMLVGFIAQIIDGALSMAYGVTSTTFLLSLGVPPAVASASVHTSEIFTSGTSGICHLHCGNVDWKLSSSLMIPGIIGGVTGAYILTTIASEIIKPFIAFYLAIMGLMILRRAYKRIKHKGVKTHLVPLGLVGGFFDAIGGGGWGPIVTSTLVARGQDPRHAIGSVNLTEFFVTVAESATFLLTIGLASTELILGLIAGGVLAAPLAAHICKRVPARSLMIAVGIIIILLSLQMMMLPLHNSLLTQAITFLGAFA